MEYEATDHGNTRATQDDLPFDNDDLSLPRWKINKTEGTFINTMTGEEKAEITAIPIRADVSRFMWPEKFSSANMPICYSTNGITPDVDNPPSDKCAFCPMQEWHDGQRPKCGKSYNYLLLDKETEILSVLNLSGARVPTARALNSFFRLNGVKFTILFYTVLEHAKSGDYWQVKFNILAKNDNWYPYAALVAENRGLLLTGGVNVEKENIIDVEPREPAIDPETGEVIQ